jgi:three-Cys-motif partner protein
VQLLPEKPNFPPIALTLKRDPPGDRENRRGGDPHPTNLGPMATKSPPHSVLDEVGPWTEIKLDIVKEYAVAYSKILQAKDFFHLYIDAFSGAGLHLSKVSGKFVSGSPLNALLVEPPFQEYHFIDLNSNKVEALKKRVGYRPDVHFYGADCNQVLLQTVFPRATYKDRRRALCLLDPYGLHLDWEVIKTAGQMESVELFLNFPIADINRNVLRRDPDKVSEADVRRMNAFWGDESWRQIGYTTDCNLFGFPTKEPNEAIAEAFRERLQKAGGFKYVLKPTAMKNSKNAVIYYLFFAAQQPVAHKIVQDIFRKPR